MIVLIYNYHKIQSVTGGGSLMQSKIRELEKKKNYYNKYKDILPKEVLKKYQLDFDIKYTHESTKIEGNTLSLIQNKMIIEDRMSVGGKTLREVYEVENHNKAFQYVKSNIKQGIKLDSNVIKDIHEILMDNIIQGGIYRYGDVIITGASHKPSARTEMNNRLNAFYYDLENKELKPLEKASWIHAEFVSIHPFNDGNGRTSRMLMNYFLMENGYLPINILAENKEEYYNSLDEYGKNKSLEKFLELVCDLEEEQLDIYNNLINRTLGKSIEDEVEPEI